MQELSWDDSNRPREEEKDEISTNSQLDAKIHILNHADAFCIYDLCGDFPRNSSSAFGFFYKGCRYLSQFEMRLGQKKLIQLSSRIKSQNEMMTVTMMNDEVNAEGCSKIPKGVLSFSRSKFILDAIIYETIAIRNYDNVPHSFDLQFHYAADFKDIFEVRGCERIRSGKFLGFEQSAANIICLRYEGLDAVIRQLKLSFSQPIVSAQHNKCKLHLEIPAQEEHILSLEVEAKYAYEASNRFGFEEARHMLLNQLVDRENLFANLSTSHNQFNHWINRSMIDFISLLAETPQGLYPYAGVPWYNTVFGRDGLISAYMSLWIAPEISKGVLLHLAHHQAKTLDSYRDAEPGKILHEARDGEMPDLNEVPFKQYYGTVDATPLFVWLAGEYLKRTDDRDTTLRLWPHVCAAMLWIRDYGDIDGDGFVEYHRKGEQGLHNQGWKDSHDAISHADGRLAEPPVALCEVQGYVYAAKLSAARIARCLGYEEKALAWEDEACQLKEKFNRVFWIDSLKTFALALDGAKEPCEVLSSNPGHCLLTGIVDEDKAEDLAKTLMSDDLSCGWGIRTLGSREKRFNPMSYHNGSVWPHDSALVAMGLSRYGFKDAARIILDNLFEASSFFEGARLPELICGLQKDNGDGPVRYPVACSPQAWSVAAVFGLLQAVLGIELDASKKVMQINVPMLPIGVESFSIQNLRTSTFPIALSIQNYEMDVGMHIQSKPKDWKILIWK